MDDIDDILHSLDPVADFSSPESTSQDYEALTRFWVAERSAPEVLPWPLDLMERMLGRVRKQITKIEDLTASTYSPTSTPPPNLNLTLSILQTDLSRTQYLIRSLLRQRLAKLTKHALHYLNDRASVLSPQEQTFLTHHHALLSNHYHDAFLSSFPPQLQRLDDNAGGLNMVDGPDTKGAVLVRCLAGKWDSSGPGGGWNDDEEEEEGYERGGGLRMRSGQIWVVRWEDVKKGVEGGKLEVL